MHRGTVGLIGAMLGALALTSWASQVGLGLPQPQKEPVSIREDSARSGSLGTGHHRTRYFFVGGGIHTGK